MSGLSGYLYLERRMLPPNSPEHDLFPGPDVVLVTRPKTPEATGVSA
jgi:hypothetical protein